MTPTYPIHFPAQLRQHLKALRKRRGLTQAKLASVLGVSQARIAEIESNPAVVSFEQLLHILSTLGVTLMLHDTASIPDMADAITDADANKDEPASTPMSEGGDAYRTASLSGKDKISSGTQPAADALPPLASPDIQHARLDTLEDLTAVREVLESNDSVAMASRALDSLHSLDPARTAFEASGSSPARNQALDAFRGLDSARTALEEFERSNAVDKALESVRGLEQARAALQTNDELDAVRKASESFNALNSAHKAFEAFEKANAAKQALNSLRGLEQVRKALAASQGSDAARNAATSLNGLASVKEALEALNRSPAAHRALASINALEQAKKIFGMNDKMQALREVSDKLDTPHTYRNLLAHQKKGNW